MTGIIMPMYNFVSWMKTRVQRKHLFVVYGFIAIQRVQIRWRSRACGYASTLRPHVHEIFQYEDYWVYSFYCTFRWEYFG
jgi:hypothetical protein